MKFLVDWGLYDDRGALPGRFWLSLEYMRCNIHVRGRWYLFQLMEES
jgi:hypothetical protein